MKHIFLNLKRFDVPREYGGVNSISEVSSWGEFIVKETQDGLDAYKGEDVEFAMFFPELHLLSAAKAKKPGSLIEIGCQGVHYKDVEPGGNFGAFTTDRPASAMKAAGCDYTIIGHCEERNRLSEILSEAGVKDASLVNAILNKEIKAALNRGLKVLYCIGEKSEEVEDWDKVLGEQLEKGLSGTDKSKVVIAYEPIWSIGPGKTPAGKEYITKVARFVKEKTCGMDVVYGGGLKQENAGMLKTIEEIDGGLIALTRFQGDLGFYPAEYLEIVKLYMEK